MKIKFAGNEMNLVGNQVKVNDNAPDFTLMNNDLAHISLKDMKGKKVFLVVPSLDTPVCDLEVRTFNEKATSLNDVSVYAISMDLPFAQARWCSAKNVNNVFTLSDYKDRSFGKNYGVLIDELGLLTRAIIIIDKNNKVIYTQYLDEITNEPNYESALQILK